MTRALHPLLFLALSLSSLSCGPTPGAIGAAGGSVASSDGARVTIPAGAIEGSIPITATSIATVGAPASTTLVGSAVTFGPEGQLFAKPVIVTLPITTSLLPTGMSASSVVIYTAPAGTTSYTALKTSVVDATHVAAPVGHFSTFVPAVASPCLSKSDCYEGEKLHRRRLRRTRRLQRHAERNAPVLLRLEHTSAERGREASAPPARRRR